MLYPRSSRWLLAIPLGILTQFSMFCQDPSPPKIGSIAIENAQRIIRITPYPAAQEFKIFRADGLDQPFVEDTSGVFAGYDWKSPATGPGSLGFYRLQIRPMYPDALTAATVLNRMAYGPTPDDLERVSTVGPQVYINEQLAPETITDDLDIDQVTVPSDWQYVKVTGTGSSSVFYIYLTSAGEGYIDDIKFMSGSVAEVGQNLIRNGDFELPLTTNDWTISPNHARSAISTNFSHSGLSSLHLFATAPGTTMESAVYQNIAPPLPGTPNTLKYTVSFWFLPVTNAPASVTARLSGSGTVASSTALPPITKLTYGSASLRDLQTWYVLHAVRAKRQLMEVLTQFCDNHFVTYENKTEDYLAGRVASGAEVSQATNFEYREVTKWRQALMNPNATFYDLLKISAESPAMVIYLDTVASKKGAANENYARELMELFTMGVDNGYDQKDIEEMARAWTGWQVDKLPVGQENNPFATPIASASRNTTPGYWTLRFNSATTSHDTGAKTIFPGKTGDARFGSPYAGRPYQLALPARTGTSGMQDGYDIIAHLADLPFTQEYISVKLCRLFVHEHFVHGVYDYTDPNLSPEAALVRDCMKAWETPAADGRKGNLRNVLSTIFNSSLFRQNAASQQKVRTPFEFTVSSIRALRAAKPTGGFTAETTGAELIDEMSRLGMPLFNREEPNGWSEFGADWINSSSLIERMRFVQDKVLKVSVKSVDPVGLVKIKLPAAQLRDSGAVADYFLNILFPGEGKANLDLDRTAAISYLNTLENGVTPSAFSSLDPNSSAYDTRVRGMVASLMGLARFQEQ